MQQRRILIVEDKEQERQLLKQLLEDPALVVDTVGEGVEALERLNSAQLQHRHHRPARCRAWTACN